MTLLFLWLCQRGYCPCSCIILEHLARHPHREGDENGGQDSAEG